MHTLIVMCGPMGCGKSTLAKKFAKTHKNTKIISRDKIRFSLISESDEYFKHEKEVLSLFYQNINDALKEYDYVIADATHLTKSARNQLFRHVNTKNVYVIGFWVEASEGICIARNSQRSGRSRVPEHVIKEAFNHKVSPAVSERFDCIYFFNTEQDICIGQSMPTIMSINEILKEI